MPEDQVLMTLEYLREYRTYFHIAQNWGVYESTAFRIIRKIENILIKSELFHLPGQKSLCQESQGIARIVIDVTESAVERPKRQQKQFYSGKKNSDAESSSGG